MPSVGLHGDENIHPGSGLSALPSRKRTQCSHMAGDILNAKKIATFSLKTGPCAEGKWPERVSRAWLCRHCRPSLEKGRRFQCLVPAAGFVYVSVLRVMR